MKNLSSRFENIISISSIPIAVVDMDMRYIAISKEWISLFKLQNVEFIGKSFFEDVSEISDRQKRIHAECLLGIDSSYIDDSFDHSDGSINHVKWDVRHFDDDFGKIGGMVMTCEDVTKNTKLGANGNRFLPFMDHFPGLGWISGTDHSFKYANKCFYETLHLTDEIIGKKNTEIFGCEVANAQNVDVLESGIGIEFEQSSIDSQGHPQFYKIYKFPFTDAKGEQNIGSIAFDVTKTTLLREELDKSEAQFKLAFEDSLIGMALIKPDGTLKRVNDSLCKMLGYSKKELKNLSIHELTYQEDKERSLTMLSKLSAGSVERLKLEKRYIHRNGDIFWVIIAATMLYNDDGDPKYYVSQIEDITKRKEIENDLILSEKKYRTIFENVQDVFYRTDHQGLVIEISPSIEKYSGYKREQIIGKPVTDFYFYSQDRDRIVMKIQSSHCQLKLFWG